MLKAFRLLGFLEGGSFLVLLLIAMPLKYLAGMPQAVRMVGMAHGILFVAYVVIANWLADKDDWSIRQRSLACLSAVLPLGTFVFDRKFLATK